MGKVAVFGDSVAWQLAGVRDEYGYADELDPLGFKPPPGIAAAGFDVINLAVPGSGCALEAMNSLETIRGDTYAGLCTAWDPDQIVVHFGGNNWPYASTWAGVDVNTLEEWWTLRWALLSIAGFRAAMDAFMAHVASPDDIVVVGGLRACWYGDCANFWADGIGRWGRYVLDVELPANYPGVHTVDAADFDPADTRLRYSDTIHLSDEGSRVLGERIAAELFVAPTLPPLEVPPDPPPVVPVFTPRYRQAMHDAHNDIVVRVDVHRRDSVDPIYELTTTDGTLTIDDADTIQRSANCTAIDPTGVLTPDLASDILSPFTCELVIWGGVKYPDRSEELKRQGTFKVTDLDIGEQDGGVSIGLTLFDISTRAQRSFGYAYVVPPGTPVEIAARDMLWTTTPNVPVNFPTTGDVTPLLILPESSNPWAEASQLFLMSGYKLEVSRDKTYTASAIVPIAGRAATWEFVEGTRSNFWNAHRMVNGDQTPNHVIVKSSNSSAGGVVGEAFDDDPTSPTYVNGPYGHLRRTYTDPRVTTNDQATRAARAILTRNLGPGESIPFEARPNWILNTSETVRVKRTALGLDTNVLIDHLELPLTAGNWMKGRTRRSVITDAAQLGAVLGSPDTTAA